MSELELAKSLLNRENEQHVEAFKARIGLDDSSYSYFEGNSTGHLMTVSRMTEAYFKSLISNFARYESELESNIENSGFDDSYMSLYTLRVDKDLKQLFWSGYSNVISAIDYDSLAAHLLFIDSPNMNPNPENNEIKTRSQEQELKIFYPIADDPFFFELVEKTKWFLEELIDMGLNYLTEEIDRFGYFNSWYTHLLKCIFEGERITSQNLQKSMAEFLGLLWVDVLALFEAFNLYTYKHQSKSGYSLAIEHFEVECGTVDAIVSSGLNFQGHPDVDIIEKKFAGDFESRVGIMTQMFRAWEQPIIQNQLLLLKPNLSREILLRTDILSRALSGNFREKLLSHPGNYSLLFPEGVPLEFLDIEEDEKAALLEIASSELKDDRDFVERALRNDGRLIAYASERLRNDPSLALFAVKSDLSAFFSLPDDVRRGEELHVFMAREKGYYSPEYAPPSLLDDKEYVRQSLERRATLQWASNRLRDDKELALLSLQNFASSYKYLSNRLRNDRDVAKFHIESYGQKTTPDFAFLSKRQSATDRFEEDSKNHPIQFASDAILDDEEIVLKAVQLRACALLHASPRLRENKKIAVAAVKQDKTALLYLPAILKSDPEILSIVNES